MPSGGRPRGVRFDAPILIERLAKDAALTALLWETALPREGVDLERAGDLTFSDLEAAPAYVPPLE